MLLHVLAWKDGLAFYILCMFVPFSLKILAVSHVDPLVLSSCFLSWSDSPGISCRRRHLETFEAWAKKFRHQKVE